MSKTTELARHLERLHINNMYKSDFYWTWDKTDEELEAIFTVADALRDLRERNKSTRIFDSGLGISIFRDNSTRTRFSFASACNLLGLRTQDLDEKKSQIAHGETLRETANMVSFMADVIGIRDDMYIGEGHKYQKTFMDALDEGYRDGILEQRPTLVNLQCDVDHPTQCMADTLSFLPTQSMAAAVISFVGQNIGASREDRARQGVRITVSLAIGWTLLSSALVVWQSDALSRIFSPDPAVIAASARYLQCVMPPYVLFSTLFVLNSAMRGAGDSLYPMFNVVASVILLRVPFLYLLADRFGPDYMYWSYGIGWAVACVLSVYHYVSGKWRGKYREV